MKAISPSTRFSGILAVLLSAALAPSVASGADPDTISTSAGDVVIKPINHATLVLEWKGKSIYVDPVGGAKRFEGFAKPDLILVTDIHGDHFDVSTLTAKTVDDTIIVAPTAVSAKMPEPLQKKVTVLNNGDKKTVLGIEIEAIPMYNLTAARLNYHSKGRGNGYVLTIGGKRFYFSGDTEDIPEMRALKNIDVAFVCFNLPYTMTEDQAASAVKEFKPKIVYPYHYRGSDTAKFKTAVGDASEVRVRDWYKQ